MTTPVRPNFEALTEDVRPKRCLGCDAPLPGIRRKWCGEPECMLLAQNTYSRDYRTRISAGFRPSAKPVRPSSAGGRHD
jgi:hypothetical protein